MSTSLETLTNEILTEARARANDIIRTAEKDLEQALSEARADAERDADEMVRTAKVQAEAVKRQILSEKKQRARITLLEEKNRIVDEVLRDAKVRMLEFTKDRARYRPVLARMIQEAIRSLGTSQVVLRLTRRDASRFNSGELLREVRKHLGQDVAITLAEEHIEGTGGAIVTSEDGRIRAENTFETRLRSMEPTLLREIGKILFGD